jgi:hypothetical protein
MKKTALTHAFCFDRRFLSLEPYRLSLRLTVFFIALMLSVSCSVQDTKSGGRPLRHNQATIASLDREMAENSADKQYCSILRGLRWCVTFCDNDVNFNFTFTNYITMLDELSLHESHPALTYIVHALILEEYRRAIPLLHKLFTKDADGYENFVSILPIAYRHHVPLEPLKKFALGRYANVTPISRLKEFQDASKDLNYDLLTDLIVDATFVDMAYDMGASRDFRLPPDDYKAFMDQCAKIPFLRKYNDDTYSDQNYYATHVVLALTHYGELPLKASATRDHVFRYLVSQYNTVRSLVGDLDLLCEYLYCFRLFGAAGGKFISEGERHVMSLQNSDGSWGTGSDFKGDPYDQLHPTWTAITLLAQEAAK